jgi:hypothetical protein
VLFCVGVWLLVRKAPEVTLKPPKPVKASGGKTAKAGR